MPRKAKSRLTSRKGQRATGQRTRNSNTRPREITALTSANTDDSNRTENTTNVVVENTEIIDVSMISEQDEITLPSAAKRLRVAIPGPPSLADGEGRPDIHPESMMTIQDLSLNSSSDDEIPLIHLKNRKGQNSSPVRNDANKGGMPVIPVEAASQVQVYDGELSDSLDDERIVQPPLPGRLLHFDNNEINEARNNPPPKCICGEPGPSTRICRLCDDDRSDSIINGNVNIVLDEQDPRQIEEELQIFVADLENEDDNEGPVDPDFMDNAVIGVFADDDGHQRGDEVRPRNRPVQIINTYLMATERGAVQAHYAGRMTRNCVHCGAKYFAAETTTRGTYVKCCAQGKVALDPLGDHPELLRQLFRGQHPLSREFKSKILAYNNAFQFASFQANLRDIPGRGPYVFAIQGQVYFHYTDINVDRNRQTFGPVYFLDPEEAARQRVENAEDFVALDIDLVRSIGDEFQRVNPLARQYRHLREVYDEQRRRMVADNFQVPRVYLEFVAQHRNRNVRRENDPVEIPEIAVVCEFDENRPPSTNMRVFLSNADGGSRLVDFQSPLCDALVFPLLFPRADQGWCRTIPLRNPNRGERARQRVSLCQYYAYRLAHRYDDDDEENFDIFRFAGRLLQKFIVAIYLRIEGDRINYFLSHQDQLRTEEYDGLVDYLHHHGQRQNIPVGRMVILPSSFLMSPRSQMQRFQDAMAIVTRIGYPTLFVTFTCNPKWPEITENLPRGDEPSNHPLLVCRVFQMKLKELMHDLVDLHVMGRCIAYLCVIEFQKRGLPHAHILITLAEQDRPTNPDRIDRLVSAEIPDPATERELFELVGRHMVHGPCGNHNRRSVCMRDNKCTKNFPKFWYNNTTLRNGRVNYRRRRNGRTIEIQRFNVRYEVDNSFIVPHNAYLLMKYQTHLNVEICANVGTVKYLYKYFFKNPDQAVMEVVQRHGRDGQDDDDEREGRGNNGRLEYNEIRSFLNGRYMTPPEASWHILQFDMHMNSHHVERLQIHLPGRNRVFFRDGAEQEAVDADVRTQLTEWFETNRQIPFARTLLFVEFPQHFVWNKATKRWTRRQRGAEKVVPRLCNVSLRSGELYYLRLLLLHVRGATSFDDIKTVDGHVCETFLEACRLRNLLAEDREWFRSLTEASARDMPLQLRRMFAYILIFGSVDDPPALWNHFKRFLCEDYVRRRHFAEEDAENAALRDVQFILMVNGRRLTDFGLPEPIGFQVQNIEGDIDVERERREGDEMVERLNADQRSVFDVVVRAVLDDREPRRLFFVTGHAGTGKTYLYNTLITYLNGREITTLPVAWTGLAASLLKQGRTVHSRFRLPVPIVENSTSSISRQSDQAQFIRDAKLIIWDEVSMATRLSFDLVDKTLRFLCADQRPFGNKCVVIGGDFKQCLPVVPNGDRATVVAACIKSSLLWQRFEALLLRTNMRVRPDERDFVDWLNRLGTNTLPRLQFRDRRDIVQIPARCVVDSLVDLVNNIFGDLRAGDVPNRAILTPLNEDCHRINENVLSRIEGVAERAYHSVDEVVSDDPAEEALFPVEFLNSLNPPGFPPSQLTLKEGVIAMLLRNLDVTQNLCNGTRLLIRRLAEHYVDAEVVDFDGNLSGERVFVPRVDFVSTTSNLPFLLKRRQFPLRVSYAMTINKAQGQSFDAVGIYLPNTVFDHGQLYVAFSRARTMEGVFVCVANTTQQGRSFEEENNFATYTKNIVYEEVL